MAKAPAYISHVVIVHNGSYKDFISKLNTKFPDVVIKFEKLVATHYKVLQLEDHSSPNINKSDLYKLPIMALREEGSSFIFFKNVKSYNTTLKRMCKTDEETNAVYKLFVEALTPFEKAILVDLDKAEALSIKRQDEKMTEMSIFNQNEFMSPSTLKELFLVDKVEVNGEEKDYINIVKNKGNWRIGITHGNA